MKHNFNIFYPFIAQTIFFGKRLLKILDHVKLILNSGDFVCKVKLKTETFKRIVTSPNTDTSFDC